MKLTKPLATSWSEAEPVTSCHYNCGATRVKTPFNMIKTAIQVCLFSLQLFSIQSLYTLSKRALVQSEGKRAGVEDHSEVHVPA